MDAIMAIISQRTRSSITINWAQITTVMHHQVVITVAPITTSSEIAYQLCRKKSKSCDGIFPFRPIQTCEGSPFISVLLLHTREEKKQKN